MANGRKVVGRARCLGGSAGLKAEASPVDGFYIIDALSLLALGSVGAQPWDADGSRLR
jgi:hypothetical protein